MKSKNIFYKNHVDRRVRLRKLIYYLILLIVFSIVLYDSFTNNLPFHYILFLFVGRIMALILKKTQKVKQTEIDNKFSVERNFAGILIIAVVIILRVTLFPRILEEFNVIFISDAILLIIMGWFLGRIKLLSEQIEEEVFSKFREH